MNTDTTPQPDLAETITKALRRAYNLGQTYWSQADSESYAQNRRSDETAAKFQALIAETVSVIPKADAPTDAEIDQSIELTWHMAWRERDQMGVAGPVSKETTELAWQLHNERVAAICDETRPASTAASHS